MSEHPRAQQDSALLKAWWPFLQVCWLQSGLFLGAHSHLWAEEMKADQGEACHAILSIHMAACLPSLESLASEAILWPLADALHHGTQGVKGPMFWVGTGVVDDGR